MRTIDLFAGIGGIRLGFEQALGTETVFASEIDKFARMTYLANFPGTHLAGDIREVDASDIPDHDMLLAGFPCQPFSISGVSKLNSMGRDHGFRDQARGTLFFEVARILDAKRPKAFMLENVKNLVSHDRGNTFKVIQGTLSEIGYHVHWKVLDAQHWVPQHRERIYIVGFLDDVPFSWGDLKIPLGGGASATSSRPTSRQGTRSLTASGHGSKTMRRSMPRGATASAMGSCTLTPSLAPYRHATGRTAPRRWYGRTA